MMVGKVVGACCIVACASLMCGCIEGEYKAVSPAPTPKLTEIRAFIPAAGFASMSPLENEVVLHRVDDWKECGERANDATIEKKANLSTTYAIGSEVSVWGCDCVGQNPTIWMDENTDRMFVAEQKDQSACIKKLDEALPLGALLTAEDNATCGGSNTPRVEPFFPEPDGGCFDLESSTLAAFEYVGEWAGADSSTMKVIVEILLPYIRALITTFGKTKDNDGPLQFLIDTNFCMGEWTGEQLLDEFHDDEENSLFTDGCTYPPHNREIKYTVISFSLPTVFLNAIGLCANPNVMGFAILCVVYTKCELGLPTFALQTNGGALACMGGNPVFAAATGGFGWLFGQKAQFVISNIGFGVSLTGEFKEEYRAWNGEQVEGTMSGNAYFYMNLGPENVLPPALKDKILIDGEVYVVVQIGDGSASTLAADLLNSKNLPEACLKLVQATIVINGVVTVNLLLNEITQGGLPNVVLGDAMEYHLILTAQSMPLEKYETNPKLLPGFYMYTGVVGPAFGVMFKFILDNFGSFIDKIGGEGVADAIQGAADKLEEESTSATLGFGLFFNTNAFGVVLTVPLTPTLLFMLAGFPPFGPAIFGHLTLSCEYRILNRRITCAAGYDAPKWITAFVKEVKKFIKNAEKFFGDVADEVDKAIEKSEKAFNTAIEEVEGFFADSAESIKKVVGDIGVWAEKAGGETKRAFEKLGSGAVEAAKDVGAAFKDLGEDALNGVNEAGKDVKKAAEDALEGAKDKAEDALEGAKDKVEDLFNWR